MQIILASGSPRRKQIFDSLKLNYKVVLGDYDEVLSETLSPQQIVQHHAKQKALCVAKLMHDKSNLIIAADTLVFCDEKEYGKPKNMANAIEMLQQLQNKKHEVLSGIAIYDMQQEKWSIGYESTEVYFRALSLEEIEYYFSLIDPLDKAGAYAIQDGGCWIVERINGCYQNVVGLPIVRLEKLMNKLGYSLKTINKV